MTQPEAPVQRFPLADRKDARSGCNSAVANDDAAVMQRRFWMKDRQDQFDRKLAIHDDACLLVNANRRVTLDRNQCAELFICQLGHCLCQIVDGFSSLTRQ